MSFIRELKKENEKEHTIFYRYRYKQFLIWFKQDQQNGNIYSVSVKKDTSTNISYYIYSDCREKFYPTKFEVSFSSFRLYNIKDCNEAIDIMNEVNDILYNLYHFFEASGHARLYYKLHKGVKQ